MIKRDVTYSESNKYCWTEDNRLQAMSDKNNGAWYNYDATGERNLKLTGQTYYINQNGQDYYTPIFDQQTLYASSLVTVNDKGYTKHYFEEGKRICSKIGSGELQDIWTLSTPIEGDYQEIHDHRSIGGVIKIFDICMGLPVEIKNKDLFKEIILPYESQVNPDEPVFYYHGDHLGSASYITDNQGQETQQLVYLPFGEDWVDMKYNTGQYDTPYKFNGKEKDEETSYNYYGARYLNNDLSIWLSVDPMSDKYPHLSSYAYCANNPVMLIDPDGREIGDPLKNMKIRRNKVGNTFGYGVRRGYDKNGKLVPRNHQGNDYYAKKGTPTYAVKDGTVVWTRNEDEGNNKKGYGNQVLLQVQNDKDETVYAFYSHLSEISVKKGDKVKEGDEIGKTGNTGNASNMSGEDEHLHFELRETDQIIGGMEKRRNPNEIVDTKFEPDPNNQGKVRQVQNNKQNEKSNKINEE